MVHVSPHGMPSGGGSRYGGNDSFGAFLVAFLVVGGMIVGLLFLLDHCQGRRSPAPATPVDAARSQSPG